jgi:hypothetical protein
MGFLIVLEYSKSPILATQLMLWIETLTELYSQEKHDISKQKLPIPQFENG